MISFLASLPLWLSGLLVVGLPTVLAMFGPVLVRRYVTLEKLEKNNEVAGFEFAAVAVLYAVLLAFAIIVVWERFSEAETNVATEAGAAANIYRLSQGINGQPGIVLREALTNYLKVVISDGWPLMERGSPSTSAREALDAVYKAVLTLGSPERPDTALVSEILRQLDTITQMRRARLSAAVGTRTRSNMADPVWRRSHNRRLRFFLRKPEPRGAGADDGHADDDYFLGTSDGHRH